MGSLCGMIRICGWLPEFCEREGMRPWAAGE